MSRFQHTPTPAINTAIALSMAAVFVADLLTPLGVAVWVFYVIPVILSLFVWRPIVPIVVAGVATGLIIANYFTDESGFNAVVAGINRTVGIVSVWAMAGVCRYSIHNKLHVRTEQWYQSGQTALNAALRGDRPLDRLGDEILKFLAEYLGAHVAAFFVEDGREFRRVAGYALPSQNGTPESFSIGEGLPGQAAKDNRAFLVRDVSDSHLAVGSALVHTLPRHLMVAPVTADGKVVGVLEFGFLQSIYVTDGELLSRVSEPVGVGVRSAKYRARLQELLEETQSQAEELQAQAEELRVSNEELEEQGRALKESAARLELQQAELEQTNSQLEEQTQLLEIQRDDLSRAKSVLESQTRELEQASRYKSDFLANMSHELRTPLNSSLILAKLLADNPQGNLTGDQVKYAETIESAGNDLLALINDILDLSKIEAGRLDVQPETVPLVGLLESLDRSFRPIAEQKGLTLRLHIEPGTPESLETDPQRLEQILKNLLSNALKFTESGEVALEIAAKGRGRITFTVLDTGIGIAEQQQEVIFEAFRQADGTTSRKYGGTGLGLSISRELVRLLGGELQVNSTPGSGSNFIVTLPRVFAGKVRTEPAPVNRMPLEAAPVAPTAPAAPTAAPIHLPSVRAVPDDREQLTGAARVILAIEDDEPFSRIIYDLAHELGFQCLIAPTADEGVAAAIRYRPHAIVLDVGLPDASGLSVLDRVKSDPRTRHIPVHVVSASDYAETAMSLGAVGYMLKPVKREELADAFRRLETQLDRTLRRVLIVEDDQVQLDSLRSLLASRDVETVGARTAAECLERLAETTFDCMVMDLSLPDASGFSLLDTLSKQDRYAFPPVIVYTGRDLTADEEQRLRRYSKSIIIKGAKSPERLLDEVTLFLHQVVAELPAEQQRMLEKSRSRDAALEGRRILVVEDDVRNVFALTSVLEPRGAIVQIARNGREAIETLERTLGGDNGRVDLVLMDMMMPEMDGLAATREIRRRAEWKKLPIIALTAKAMKSDQERCIEAGVNDYMAKPLDVEKLLSLIRVWMPR